MLHKTGRLHYSRILLEFRKKGKPKKSRMLQLISPGGGGSNNKTTTLQCFAPVPVKSAVAAAAVNYLY